jgi:hypothetical protein
LEDAPPLHVGCTAPSSRGCAFTRTQPRPDVALPIVVTGGSPSAWATRPPADSDSARCRRLIINGGFRVDGGRYRQLEGQASALGYPDLRTCLQALCDAGYSSTPRLAKQLGSTPWLVSRALQELGVRLPVRPERLAQQRRRAAEERIAARVMELGFADVWAYLVDRIVERGWLVVEVVAELGAAPGTVRRLLQCHGVRRVRRTGGGAGSACAGP